MDGRALQRSAAKMGFTQPDPPFAQRRHPLLGHAEGSLGHEHFLRLVEFVDRALIGLRKLQPLG